MHHESFFGDPRNWVVLAFVLFFVLFGKRLWGALAAMLDARATGVKAELEEAARLRREAESMLRDAEQQRADAMTEAKALIDGARAEAIRVAATAAKEAEASSKRREQMARDRITAAEKAAVEDVRIAVADITTIAVRQFLAEDLTDHAANALIDHGIAQLPAVLTSRKTVGGTPQGYRV